MDIGDTKSPVLLQLFDDSIGEQRFDVRLKSVVMKSRHSDAVNVREIMRFDVADVIAGASAQAHHEQQSRDAVFHCGVALASGVGAGVGTGGRSGAPVGSVLKEVGGGSDSSLSGGGKGATSAGEVCIPGAP